MVSSDEKVTALPHKAGAKRVFSYSPVRLIVVVFISIVLAEMVGMTIINLSPAIPDNYSMVFRTWLDSFIQLFFLVLILRRFMFKPMEEQIHQRESAEESLTQHRADLERIVEERTARLTTVVRELEKEVAERRRTEEALQSSEERFRQLFQQTEDAIILFKPGSCRIIDVNPVAERLYGFSKQELFELGPSCFIREADYAGFCETITGVRPGENLRVDNATHMRKDGTEIVVSLRGKTVTIQNVELVYCTMRDITTRIRLEEQARLIQAKLIHTNKMASLGVLVASIAHEVNNPNNFIMVNSEILAKSWKDISPVLREHHATHGDFMIGGIPYSQMNEFLPDIFTGIRDGSRRIKDIINNLKNFARDGKSRPDGRIDLNHSVAAAVSILNHQIKKHTRNFRMELAESLPPVKGSAQQLEQVVMNLIMNAIQSLPSEDRGVLVSTLSDQDRGEVVLRVADEGKGIPRDIAERIFEPFFTTRLDSGGSGLGLAICYSIVKEHQGDLDFESNPGQGTTFTVRLPALDV